MKKFILSIVIFFIAIQFIKMDIQEHIDAPKELEIKTSKEIAIILKNSCYDCHSNSVNMPLYGYVAPISWYVRDHIKSGRKVLNFSEFNAYDETTQQKKYEKIIDATVIRMPLPSYTLMHKSSELSYDEKQLIKAWVKSKMQE
ncbi:MAG: heme-binding domain-containing protein [Campylobacterales bacterium]|nr:heme-binding domain-containing protein [Campylobacterales bacterium]